MGMSASQAKLLDLTTRLHNVELQAQNIESQKIALAIQEDRVYQEYCDAYNATKYQVAFKNDDGTKAYKNASFETLCKYSDSRQIQYALKDSKSGQIIVPKDVVQNYKNYGNDKYSFAWAMLGFAGNCEWTHGGSAPEVEETVQFLGIGTAQDCEGSDYNYVQEQDGSWSLYMTEVEQAVYDKNSASDTDLSSKYNDIKEAETTAKKKDALEAFRKYLYENYSNEIFEKMNINKDDSKENSTDLDFPELEWNDIKEKFSYYTKLWETINESGGCKAIDKDVESGEKGEKWLKNMVESGLVTIMMYNDGISNKGWNETSIATNTNENYLQEVNDTKDQKQAEIKYEHEMKIINKKDTDFDNELSKLETERTSITTEMDSIKKVRDENVERTFGIFS